MNVNAFRQRLGRTTNGKYSETELINIWNSYIKGEKESTDES